MTTQSLEAKAKALNDELEGLDLAGRLALVAGLDGRAVFTTSLGIEDQVITAAIGSNRLAIDVATLKTGRLFNETVALVDKTEETYGILIKRYYPEKADIEAYVAQYGMNGFYESVEARHACCGVRKLKPLARALEGASYWITGLRRGQSVIIRGRDAPASAPVAHATSAGESVAIGAIERGEFHPRRVFR